ncbi:MAG: hypothetical protein A2946_03760 [Candidatus Liptonbacteria bacterium RIFCSPLOWO2_01_FULL_53_13]|uniref:Uncharacterized protein n=1 Tax=Candidatus Liptonbacteria bacterium RIFCSPLOWO2_01_FULL_53_13 TaxID=1798651 RepID=A0A1G2CLB2_9BACT|nr:MAG: hypothetical protein A2946_03760 [Candidatus Liptonbacteria bacterium RIFCSPLOWO2_01_FULL_53_13]
MTERPGKPEREVSQEDWDDLMRRAEELHKKGTALQVGLDKMSHASHILANLTFALEKDTLSRWRARGGRWYDAAQLYALALEKYLELLEEFPEFKKKEIKEEDGAFPDIKRRIADSVRLVDEMERRLRREAQG